MTWELIQTEKQEWKQDNSGLYTIINWTGGNRIRVDVMTTEDEPVISFEGNGHDLRLQLMKWIDGRFCQKTCFRVSCEHAAYIGAEIARAELLLKENYIQE